MQVVNDLKSLQARSELPTAKAHAGARSILFARGPRHMLQYRALYLRPPAQANAFSVRRDRQAGDQGWLDPGRLATAMNSVLPQRYLHHG